MCQAPLLMEQKNNYAPQPRVTASKGGQTFYQTPSQTEKVVSCAFSPKRMAYWPMSYVPNKYKGRFDMKCIETAPRRLRVFLCHGSEDKNRVRELYADLREDGVDPWLDEKEILPGQDWKLEITKAVQATDIVIVCLSSRSSTKSGFVQKEIKFALDKADEKPEGTIFVIPVKLEECKVPERLHHLHWVNYFEEKGYENILRALRKGAEDLGLRVLSSGDLANILGNSSGEASRLIYKSRNIRELLRRAKNNSSIEIERPIISPLEVVKISFEAMEEALAPFTSETRRSQAKDALIRLVGIRPPYHEWQENTAGMHCFRNKVENGQLDFALKGEQKKQAAASDKDFLTEEEMNRFLESAQYGQHSVRDYLMMLMAYRHGSRSSELIDIRIEDLDLETNRLYVRRKNGGRSMRHPIEEDEMSALRTWLQKREQHRDAHSPFLFLGERGPMSRQAINYLVREIGKRAKLDFQVNPHMLRHSTGYFLASRGYDTSLVQVGSLDKISEVLSGSAPHLLAVHALETSGMNVIPQVFAKILSRMLDLPVATGIIQINRVTHTGSSGYQRLAFPALFGGEVREKAYFLVDDFIGQGGTLMNLKGFVERQGAHVVGATALTGKSYSAKLKLEDETLKALRTKHGTELEQWWNDAFGYGFERLTESEARYLTRADNAYAISERIVAAGAKRD